MDVLMMWMWMGSVCFVDDVDVLWMCGVCFVDDVDGKCMFCG